MTSLNHIPEHLRDSRNERDWSPGQGLKKGAVCTMIAALILGVLSTLLGFYLPALVAHWALSIVAMFVITALLHGVVHESSGLVSNTGNTIAIVSAILVLIGTHLAVLAGFAATLSPPVSPLSLFSLPDLFVGHFGSWVGLLAAAFWCKDGNNVLEPLVDLLGRNALTLRR